jgi:tRNA nucleotidyltransferase (CCA-adding enzyme)
VGIGENDPGGLVRDGRDVVDALAGLPGGRELLELAAGRDDVALIGGAVRDLLLGAQPRELDVVVAGGAMELANALASRLGVAAGGSPSERSESTFHERFRTALVCWSGGRIDIATRRAESYPAPGMLPEVRAGSSEEDLARRDFTVNAIAVPLAGRHAGELLVVEHALEDLHAGSLRVLHEQSFIDDPTRLMRLARYGARLGFEPDPHTAALAAAALAGDALGSVSHARLGAELRLALSEADPVASLASLQQLGVLAARGARLQLDASLAATALALLPADGHPQALLMATLLSGGAQAPAQQRESALQTLLDGFEFPAAERERIMRSVLAAPSLAAVLERPHRPSQLHAALVAYPPEAVALAGALAGTGTPGWQAAREWLQRLRDVRLSIGGDDLLAAGIPAGPEVGRRLAAALAAKLDGELEDGRAAELAAALEVVL